MVNRRVKPAQLLSLVRKLARARDLAVEELPGRGKDSHRIFALVDSGQEVERFGITGHGSKDLSWRVLQRVEERLAPPFGKGWTEKR